MKRTLAADRMSRRALWDRVFVLTYRARPLVNQGPQDLDLTLQQLEVCLHELKLRGEQLSLMPEPETAPPLKSA